MNPSERRAVLIVVATALLIRLAVLVVAADARPVLDERLYQLRAEALLDGAGFVGSYQSWLRHPGSPSMAELPQYAGAYQPPGYTVLVATAFALSGRSPLAVKLVQVMLGSLTVALVYLLGRAWIDHRRGLVAAWIVAGYPTLIAFTHYVWSETLFIFLLTAGIWLLTREARLPSMRTTLAAGGILGLAVLTRGVLFFFLPLLALWLVASHRDRFVPATRRAAALLVAALVVIAPWSLRSSLLHNGFVLVDTAGGFNLWRGNAPDTFADRPTSPEASYAAPFARLPLLPVAGQDQRSFIEAARREVGIDRPTDLQIVRAGRLLARRQILGDPALFVQRAFTKSIDLWNPTSFLMRQFRLGAYGAVSPSVELVISCLAVLSYLLVAALAVVGAAGSIRDRQTQLVLLLVLFTWAASIASFGLTRFRLPVIPFLAILAARGLFDIRALQRRAPGTTAL